MEEIKPVVLMANGVENLEKLPLIALSGLFGQSGYGSLKKQ